MIEIQISLLDGSLLWVKNLGDSPKDKLAFDGVVDILTAEGLKYLKRQEEKQNEK